MLRKRWCSTHRLVFPLALVLGLSASAWASTTATITVGGSEQQINGAWDQGAITVEFNSFSETVTYGEFSSAASVASALAGMFSRDYVAQGLSAKVSCPPNTTLITFTLQGTATFGSLGVSGPSSSFSISSSGFQSSAAQATPVLTWPLPAAITYGTALSGTQLNATANVAGTFSYSPPAGTVLPPGDQALSVMFTPTDTTDYSVVTEAVPLTVNASSGGGGSTVYSYGLSYDPSSNVDGYNDSVMGAWAFQYDDLNRLAGAQGSQPINASTNYCWSYDAFGNRVQQMGSNEAISGGGDSLCQQQQGANIAYTWANYSANNRMTSTVQAPGGVQYDAAGDVTNDGKNQYLYNADGQICAVEWTYNSLTVMTGYIYDADGNRVAKGTITTMSCDPSVNGFTTQADYVRDQAGHQLSEFVPGQSGSMAWQHTNIYANGVLIATDDQTETHFYLNDWLGTRRVQTDYQGTVEQTCASLPYGDNETCAPTPTENLFTGKERDTESGNDYFGARYYASMMGRFLSPDWASDPTAVPYASYANPQSLNLYNYMRNNPLSGVDPDGHCCFEQDLASWITTGIAAYGPKQFSEDVGVGALKGLGQTAYTFAAAGANQYNPAGFVSSMLNEPSAITPSDTTQAQAAFATSVIVSAAVPAAGLETAGADATAEIPEVASESFGIKGAQAPDQVAPGIGNVKGVYDGEHGAQPYSAHYDQFGRQTGRTDYTSAPDATNHPNPHYHTREYGPGYGPKGKESGPIPGEHPQDQQ